MQYSCVQVLCNLLVPRPKMDYVVVCVAADDMQGLRVDVGVGKPVSELNAQLLEIKGIVHSMFCAVIAASGV